MGWKAKSLTLLLGLLLLASGLWPLSLICFLWLWFSFRSRSAKASTRPAGGSSFVSLRGIIGSALLFLSLVAFLSGGTFSPILFFAAGCISLWSNQLVKLLPNRVSRVRDSILLRSKFNPFTWYALAEVKAGPEEFTRAVSAIEGRLVLFTETGRVLALVKCLALNRGDAETMVLEKFRSVTLPGLSGAHLLPLDGAEAESTMRMRLIPAKLSGAQFAESASRIRGVLTVECGGGFVLRASAYGTRPGGGHPQVPICSGTLTSPPLVWELLEALEKRTRWPEPDGFSTLLDSLVATKGVPLAERLRSLESSEDRLMIRSLSGEEVRTSRPQMRAIISLYT